MNKVLLLLCLSTILSTSNSFTRQLVYSSTCSLVNSSTRRLLFRVNEVGVSDVVQHLGEELT